MIVARIRPVNLRCEYLTDPLGIDARQPRLSWGLVAHYRDQFQTAYQIIVATHPDRLNDPDLWDSGRVESADTAHIVYGGAPLTSGMQCWWSVRVWDGDGDVSAYSAPARWSMGLLDRADWSAQWIGLETTPIADPSNDLDLDPVVYLRRPFRIEAPVRRATLHVTALGVYQMRLNGARVGDAQLTPEWTDYARRVMVQTYEVTNLLRPGDNLLAGLLGTGWYAGHVGLRPEPHAYGAMRWLLAQCHIEYADGTEAVIGTDADWRAATGPILFSDLLMGETYDAARAHPGWDHIGFDAADWSPVIVQPTQPVRLVAQPTPPIRIMQDLMPQTITEPSPGVYIFDLGQNIVGWARLKLGGCPAGTRIRLRFGEMLTEDGQLYTANLRRARATDTLISGGDALTYEPTFTFHGFRYVELTGCPHAPGPENLTGRVIYNDLPATGLFECGNPLVNQLWSNIVWGQRGNFISIPTDCPQRDERLGWSADAQVFARAAAYNMDVAAFFSKWLLDLADGQTPDGAFRDFAPLPPGLPDFLGAPGWGDAGVIVPWTLYRVYGDTRILARLYEPMSRWMAYLQRADPDLLRSSTLHNNYADWLAPDPGTPGPLIGTAYWAYCARLLGEIAAALDKADDVRRWRDLHRAISAAFVAAYTADEGGIVGDTQTGYVLALHMVDLPDDRRRALFGHLLRRLEAADWHLGTGFLGTPYLNLVLTRHGRADIAYRLLLNETYPSWLYPIHQGATTVWERWDSWHPERGFQTPDMNSFNHYAFGAVGEWLFRSVAGIDLQRPGFREIAIHPRLDRSLGYVRAQYDSIAGRIGSAWRFEGAVLRHEVIVPPNTVAHVYLPAVDRAQISEKGVPVEQIPGVRAVEKAGETTVVTVGSGEYQFKVMMG